MTARLAAIATVLGAVLILAQDAPRTIQLLTALALVNAGLWAAHKIGTTRDA